MLKTYFKQALVLFRQNRLFSTLYIAGTGLLFSRRDTPFPTA